MNLTHLFCDIDDFFQSFEEQWKQQLLESSTIKRYKPSKLSMSEVMTITVAFHHSKYRTFKHFYIHHVMKYWCKYFPKLVSYNRFVELMSSTLVPLSCYLNTRKGKKTGISFVDSTTLKVCHNRRIISHKVFKDIAQRGKNSIGWFYGFKLHLIVNECGELLAFRVTPGNVDDREPVPKMTKEITGKLFGDKGYISHKLFKLLFENKLQLVTPIKKNMHNKLLPLIDKILIRKRAIIETINDQLKNISQIEHTRHRSLFNCMVNLVAGLIAYTYQDKKPSLNLKSKALKFLTAAF